MTASKYTFSGFSEKDLVLLEADRVSPTMFGRMLTANDVKQLFILLNDKVLLTAPNLAEPISNCWARVFKCHDKMLYVSIVDYDPYDERSVYGLDHVFVIEQDAYMKLWSQYVKSVRAVREAFKDYSVRSMFMDRYLGVAHGSRYLGADLNRAQMKMCKLLGNFYKFTYFEDRID